MIFVFVQPNIIFKLLKKKKKSIISHEKSKTIDPVILTNFMLFTYQWGSVNHRLLSMLDSRLFSSESF